MDIGDCELEFLGHSGFSILCKEGKRIVIDPYDVSEGLEKADILLITHSHYDHCSIEDIKKIIKEKTIVVMPADCQSKIAKLEGVEMQIAEVGDKINLGNVKIEAVAAYNVSKDFHPKSEGWLGYVVKVGNVIVYHAGDTDKIPEMQKLSGYGKRGNEFVALLPVSGKFVMGVEEAVEAASLISPDLCVPMHYGAGVAGTVDDAARFVELCKEKNINSKIMGKI